ncbi:uncharacterized protein LOC134686399 [Mytilus trossulus]|uniref:uncharacterized protein LOC134686399 n=1 Tax=Mytilus trossulus TaxID=6551 RepID=UPI0030061147
MSHKMLEVERKCHKCGDTTEVSWKCEACNILLCFRCGNRHAELGLKHSVVNFEKNEEAKPILKIKQCDSHKERDISNFCLDCNKPVCSTCLSTHEHQGHVLEENEIIYMRRSNKLRKYSDKFKSYFLPFFSREQERLDEMLKHHQDMIEEEKQRIIDNDKELKDKITQQTDHLLQELENQWEDTRGEIKQLKQKTERNIVAINSRVQLIDMKQTCNDIDTICELENDTKVFQSNIDHSYLQLPLEGKKFRKEIFDEIQIENIVSALEKVKLSDVIDFSVLGSFDTNTESIDCISVNEDDTIWTNFNNNLLRKYKMDLEKGINMLEKKPIAVNDIAMTNSGDLLLAVVKDHCIKTLNKSGTIKDFYNYKTGLLRTPIHATAVHVQKNGNVLVGFKEDNPRKETIQKIFVLTPNGRKERQLELANENRESLCTLVYRLTTNNNNDDIIIVDQISINEGQIVAIDKSNQLKWCYTGNTAGELQNTFSPRGLVTTSQNNFIVCDERNNALHVLNENGQVLLYKDKGSFEIESPYAIAINNKGHILLSRIKQDENKGKAVISVLRFTGC